MNRSNNHAFVIVSIFAYLLYLKGVTHVDVNDHKQKFHVTFINNLKVQEQCIYCCC